jgi:hypothetical protein
MYFIFMFMYSYCYVCNILCILYHCVVLCIVCVKCVLPPGVHPTAVNKYIIKNLCFLQLLSRATISFMSPYEKLFTVTTHKTFSHTSI